MHGTIRVIHLKNLYAVSSNRHTAQHAACKCRADDLMASFGAKSCDLSYAGPEPVQRVRLAGDRPAERAGTVLPHSWREYCRASASAANLEAGKSGMIGRALRQLQLLCGRHNGGEWREVCPLFGEELRQLRWRGTAHDLAHTREARGNRRILCDKVDIASDLVAKFQPHVFPTIGATNGWHGQKRRAGLHDMRHRR